MIGELCPPERIIFRTLGLAWYYLIRATILSKGMIYIFLTLFRCFGSSFSLTLAVPCVRYRHPWIVVKYNNIFLSFYSTVEGLWRFSFTSFYDIFCLCRSRELGPAARSCGLFIPKHVPSATFYLADAVYRYCSTTIVLNKE